MATNDGPPAKRRKLDLYEEVMVLVGPSKTRATVPKCILTRSSDFLAACCKGEWKEAKTKTIKLPEIDPDSFSIYLQWLYKSELVTVEQGCHDEAGVRDLSGDEKFRIAGKELMALLKLAVLADKLGDLELSNATVDALKHAMDTLDCGPGVEEIPLVYEQLPENSPIRRMMVDNYTVIVTPKYLMDNKKLFPPDFFFDLMMNLVKNEPEGIPNSQPYPCDKCKYHQHNDKAPKCSED
ncbi:hypothetical protein LTR37_005847 [Vermiconidia calcicola]|uniref:Uncharacterized protein n=1 Tax=Vermiconidia calcicola TaxID=1690605 RepID=A0ACC3NII4_9PEZI|nr:hypothetical protein LTR37_005847 [Vermiconidia calcicola]